MTDLKQFIRDLNETWQYHRYDDLYEYFHDNVVLLPPGSGEPIVGIEPMVQSYRQFGSMATIHGFEITDLTLYNYNSVAMCHLRFHVDYEIESGRFREDGMDVYAIDVSGPKPKVVWRSQVTLTADET
jgi:hypothetical protein